MSRPLRPLITVPTWATGTNYPVLATPWDSTPYKSAPLNAFFTPGNSVPAQEMNYTLNAMDAASQAQLTALLAAYDQLSQVQAQNWPYQAGVTSGYSATFGANIYASCMCWDPFLSRWLMTATDGGTSREVYTSRNGGILWDRLGAAASVASGQTATPACMAVRPSDGLISWIWGTSYYTGRGNVVGALPAGVTSGLTPPLFEGNEFWFNSLFVAVGTCETGSVPHDKCTSITSPDGVTWTDRTAAMASAGMGTAGAGLACAASPTTIVAMVRNQASTGFQGAYSTNGTAWTAIPAVTTTTVTSRKVQAVAWSAVDSVFLMLAFSTGTNNTEVWKSADGISWSLQSTIDSTVFGGGAVTGINCCGSLWVSVVLDNNGSSGRMRALVSTDVGVTWKKTAGVMNLGTLRTNVQSSGGQFMLANDVGAIGGLIAGLP